ncbi:MAG TPA: NosD domain-containing protein, partial [Candidatus Acidoferrum sp.]|nr:NosD domain-containing protein [Candidatus Acidoferrum sp.]
MDRAVFASLAILCLLSISSTSGLIQVVKASGVTVFIRADGSIDPANTPILSLDNITYAFTGDISYPTYDGIVVERSNIVIDGNGYTVQGSNSGSGLSLTTINNVTIENINIRDFQNGIILGSSSNNTVSSNTASANIYGVWLDSSSNNTLYHNNFMNNTYQVGTVNSTNTWDDGYPSGGNYWSDYTGVDKYSGPNQNYLGSDGIGDTPYVIDANNTDHYPLMKPYA